MKSKFLVLKVLNKVRKVPISKIAFFETHGKETYTFIDFTEIYWDNIPLKVYEEKLKKDGFYRISRKQLINIQHVREIICGATTILVMDSGDRFTVSQRKISKVIKAFQETGI
ncbi:MAG: LytTR family transcriptional regulator [Bacteroidales bacterium]|nr:LytTR family transcriptional regulator [Bacteroidales bacterium]